MVNIRMGRINSTMQTLLAETIKNELQDNRLDGAIVSILKVDVANDLSHANINVSIFGVDEKEAFHALLNSVPYLRKTIAKKMQLRIVPQLHFVLDGSLEYADKMNALLNKIKKN
ncbi:MAG: ribosome-binding factor A [Tenericutes bacterium HGW-Tenericutes-4]|jgi:ribosome-binding factor A|nr:MAG: ribosome-binding factor A [Tenericutes bacterium HGW-Tenericutes-4]